jgi:hypothetical protein
LGSAKWQSILMALRTVKYYTHMSGWCVEEQFRPLFQILNSFL